MTSLVRREIFLDAVFLWIIPFATALSMAAIALFKAVFAPSIFLFTTSTLTFFERVFNMLLMVRFLKVLGLVCLALFIADLLFFGAAFAGNGLSSLIKII